MSSLARRLLLTLAAASLAFASGPAFASSAPKKKEGAEGEAKVDPVVKLASMALPIVADGRLVNYVFIELSLTLAPTALPADFAGKEPMLRDAITREAHRKPFIRPDSYVLLDEPRLKAFTLKEATHLAGPGKIIKVEIVKQTPRRFIPPPPKPDPKAPVRTVAAESRGGDLIP